MFKDFAKTTCNVIKTIDKTADVIKSLQYLAKQDVLVGIPQEESSRQGTEITNAELGFIHTHGVREAGMREEMDADMQTGSTYSEAFDAYVMEHGDPLWHAPPRPFLEPAIDA